MTTLMIQGTTSDAGKSPLVAALCRWLKRRAVRVAPFTPQNMALNSAVTVDGGEIDRGGVFAHPTGTLALLSASEQARVADFIINRFRRDIALLEPGLDWLRAHTGKPVLGVLPYLHGLHLDGAALTRLLGLSRGAQ